MNSFEIEKKFEEFEILNYVFEIFEKVDVFRFFQQKMYFIFTEDF